MYQELKENEINTNRIISPTSDRNQYTRYVKKSLKKSAKKATRNFVEFLHKRGHAGGVKIRVQYTNSKKIHKTKSATQRPSPYLLLVGAGLFFSSSSSFPFTGLLQSLSIHTNITFSNNCIASALLLDGTVLILHRPFFFFLSTDSPPFNFPDPSCLSSSNNSTQILFEPMLRCLNKSSLNNNSTPFLSRSAIHRHFFFAILVLSLSSL